MSWFIVAALAAGIAQYVYTLVIISRNWQMAHTTLWTIAIPLSLGIVLPSIAFECILLACGLLVAFSGALVASTL